MYGFVKTFSLAGGELVTGSSVEYSDIPRIGGLDEEQALRIRRYLGLAVSLERYSDSGDPGSLGDGEGELRESLCLGMHVIAAKSVFRNGHRIVCCHWVFRNAVCGWIRTRAGVLATGAFPDIGHVFDGAQCQCSGCAHDMIFERFEVGTCSLLGPAVCVLGGATPNGRACFGAVVCGVFWSFGVSKFCGI